MDIECLVIGAGVIGLAVARALSRIGIEVVVVDAEDSLATHASSRNSGVLHAGLYYPPSSIKALDCVSGRQQLIKYCVAHGIDFRLCGKFVVAVNEPQRIALAQLMRNAQANGVQGLRILDRDQLQQCEPRLEAVAALVSPATGIIDTQQYLLQLVADVERHGGHVLLQHAVVSGEVDNVLAVSQLLLDTPGGELSLRARHVINCAGFNAQRLLKSIRGFDARSIPQQYYAKGNYFSIRGDRPFSRLIYPPPDQAGLGIHFTLDLHGGARFGPDVQWLSESQLGLA